MAECVCGGTTDRPNPDCERCQLVAEMERLAQRVAELENTLSDAAMCIRRLLSRCRHIEPRPEMLDQIQDWLVRVGLQGSVLRAPPSPATTNAEAEDE